MDRVRATRLAARVGQTLAIGLGLLGLLGNPFLILIAVFVWIGAASEANAVEIDARLNHKPAGRAMITDFQTIAPHAALSHAIDLTLAGSQKDFPVVESDGTIAGVLTQSAILRGLQKYGADGQVGQVMQPAHSADITRPLAQLLEELRGSDTRLVCITRDGELEGIVNLDNITEFLRIQAALAEH
jgi:CBS domain-containing protein